MFFPFAFYAPTGMKKFAARAACRRCGEQGKMVLLLLDSEDKMK